MRIFATLSLLSLLAACSTHPCKDGSLFVTLDRSGAALSATELDVTVTVDGAASMSAHASLADIGAHTTLSLDFKSGYPAGKSVALTFSAVDATGAILATYTYPAFPFAKGCESLTVTLPHTDISGTTDGGGADFAGCVSQLSACPATQTCGTVDDGCGNTLKCATDCAANAIAPRLANTGTVVTIEGTFTAGATIDFPGAPGVALTTVGAHRASVAVPATATAGPAVVHSGNQALPVGNFRRASFTLEPRDLEITSSQASGARQGIQIATARKYETLTEVNGWIYAIGGSTATSGSGLPTASVERTRVNADGTLGFSEPLKVSLNTARYGHATVVLGDRLWVLGGATDDSTTGSLRSAEWATVNADGTLSAFTVVADLLTIPRAFATAHVVGDHVLVIAGSNDGIDTTSVESAPVTGDTLAAFALVPNVNLGDARRAHASFVTASQLVVIGGVQGPSTELATVELSPLDANGVPGPFVGGPPLPDPGSHLSGLSWGSTLFACPFIATTDVHGNIGSFTETSITTYGVSSNHFRDATPVLARDHLYLLSKNDSDDTTYDTYVGAALTNSATLGPWANSTTAKLAVALSASGGAVIGNSLYLIGGQSMGATNKVYRAIVAPDDSISDFTEVAGVTLPIPLFEHTVAVTASHVVVLGGGDTNGAVQSSVYQADIKADDTLTTFAPSLNSFNAPITLTAGRRGIRALIVDDWFCTMGGYLVGGTYTNTYECTPITAVGGFTLGFMAEKTPSVGPNTLVTPRAYFTASFQKGLMAVYSGGAQSPVTSVEVQTPSFFSQGTNYASASWATASAPTAPQPRSHTASLFVGSTLYLAGSDSTDEDVYALDLDAFTGAFMNTANPLKSTAADSTGFVIGNVAYVVAGSSVTVQQSTLR